MPCRQTGDVLISYEPHGNDVDVIAQRWVSDAWDDRSGCATRGHLDDVALTPNTDVQGAVNPTGIATSLPGAYGATIPAERFGEAAIDLGKVLGAVGGGCFAFTSAWMHSRSSNSETSQMEDYVAPEGTELRRCAASGTKFLDRDADSVRDEGEPGLPRFVVFADYDDDGAQDSNEPFSITDSTGRYVVHDIRPPDGTYTLREALLPNTPGSWTCSFPNAGTPGGFGARAGRFPCGRGPITVAEEPYPRGRDFGNWLPAQLTVRKEIYPPDDPGRFDLLVNGEVALAGAGDEATTTLEVPPGSYTVTERAVGVPASDYASALECKLATRRARRASGPSATFVLTAGQEMRCTFHNVRRGAPGIAIDKAGPAVAMAGATLNYTLRVTNPGDVPFPEAAVDVTDPFCDAPPVLTAKESGSGPDASPGTLDPGDTWTYRCSRATAASDADCETRVVTNTGSATGTANGTTVEDESSIGTILRCPEPPAPPPEPPAPPGPDGGDGATDPAAVAPPGPVPPAAGAAGRAAVFRSPACLRRGSRVTIAGAKIARVVVRVGGEVVRGLSVRPLDDRATIRLRRNFAPGSYRVKARVTFQRGAGTEPVTLTRRVRVCDPRPPRFTG